MAVNYWEKLEEGVTYHIYNRSVGNDNLFFQEGNYSYFIEKWKEYLPYLDVYAYCLMPNHFHFLAQVKSMEIEALQSHLNRQCTVKSEAFLAGKIVYSEYLEDQIKRLCSSYALAVNKQQERHGTLFQKRFKRISVTTEHRLCYLLAYIHHNPIHHRFVEDYSAWKYSSWATYKNLNSPSSVNRITPLSWYGKDIASFFQYHEAFKLDKNMELEGIDYLY